MKISRLVLISIAASAIGLNVFAQDRATQAPESATHQHAVPQEPQKPQAPQAQQDSASQSASPRVKNHASHQEHHAVHHADHQQQHKGKSGAKKASAGDRVMADLQASANAQVLQDEVRLVFAHEAQGKTAAEVNRALTQALEQARAAVTIPAGVSLSSGSFRTSQAFNKEGRPDGWRGRAELLLQSTDLAATEKVAGLLGTRLALTSVNFSLSPDKRRQTEQALLKEVAQAFRDKASAAASAFGFERYKIVSLDFGGQGSAGNAPMLMRSAPSVASPQSDPIVFSLDPGLIQVSIAVSGKVRFD